MLIIIHMRGKPILPIITSAFAFLVAFTSALPASAQALSPSGWPQEFRVPIVKLPHPNVNPSTFAWKISFPQCNQICIQTQQLTDFVKFRVSFRSLNSSWTHDVVVDIHTFSIDASRVPFPGRGEYEWQVWVDIRVPGYDALLSYPASDPPRRFQIVVTRPSVKRPPITPPITPPRILPKSNS